MRPCSHGPPHSCRDFFSTETEEERETLDRWAELSKEQARGERRRPDLPVDKDGRYPSTFYCALLQSVRSDLRTDRSEGSAVGVDRLREDSSSSEDMTGFPNSPLHLVREEAEDLPPSSEENSEIETESDQTVETDEEDENFLSYLDVEGLLLHPKLGNRHILSVGLCGDHSRLKCKAVADSYTDEEWKQFKLWEKWSAGQEDLQGELVYPCEEYEEYPDAFYCAALREVRKLIHDEPDQRGGLRPQHEPVAATVRP